jgi:hypothetical protein
MVQLQSNALSRKHGHPIMYEDKREKKNHEIALSLHRLFTQTRTTSPMRFQLLASSVELTSLLKFQLCPQSTSSVQRTSEWLPASELLEALVCE